MPEIEFYRPNPATGRPIPTHYVAQGRALLEIHALASSGLPVTLGEARKRIAAICLIAQEGLGPETVFEMVCRILATGPEPVTR